MQKDVQDKFVASVLREFQDAFLEWKRGMHSASRLHQQTLVLHHTHMAELKSHRSCFCCFMRMPEKVLACGHALCDSCIRVYGRRLPTERNTYMLPECVLCGVNYKPSYFQFVPPTAGIRILSVDGGGVRGIVPLAFLQHLDRALAWLHSQVRDHFDFVCGTSAGIFFVFRRFVCNSQ
jgi:hypothetical protein